MNNQRVPQRRPGTEGNCLIYGCAATVVLGIVGVLVIGFGLRQVYTHILNEYTDDVPIELAVIEVTDEDRDSVIERVDSWVEAMDSEGAKVPLTLTERDINILIQNHEELEELNGRVYVAIDDSVIKGEVSVPLSEIPGFDGRYFNGSADFEVELSNGRLSVYAVGASVKGNAVPDDFMQQVRNENFAADVNKEKEAQELFERIESIEVKDGTIIIIPFGAEASTETGIEDVPEVVEVESL